MSKMWKLRKRRHRRTGKQVMKHGSGAKRAHKRKTGRTGAVFSKQLLSRKQVSK